MADRVARAEFIKTTSIFFAQGPQIMYLSTHMIYCDVYIWLWEFHILFHVLNYMPGGNWLNTRCLSVYQLWFYFLSYS